MVYHSWKETTSTIIQNCFHRAGFKHHHEDPDPVTERPTCYPSLKCVEIINLVHTENDAPQEESEDENEETPSAKLIKSTTEFLAIINQQKAFMKRNNLPIKLVKQLETLVFGNQIALCSKQREVTNYLKTASEIPKGKDVYKTVADVNHDITIVDSLNYATLEMDTMDMDSINITKASGAMNALLANVITPGRTSTPKHKNPELSTTLTAPKKKLKMNAATVREKLDNMRDSDVNSLDTESDSQLLISSQE